MLRGWACEKCGAGLTFSNEGAFCSACRGRSEWPDEKLRELYFKLEPNELETDPVWWKECLEVVRKVLRASDDGDAVDIVRRAGWGDLTYAARLRRLAGIPQLEHTCPTCAGTGKVKR